MMPPCHQLLLSAIFAVLTGASALAGCEAVPRTTLALYDSAREASPRDTRIHRYAELVLNYLGHVVIYHDLARNATPSVNPASVGLVMSWLDAPVGDVSAVGAWLAQDKAFCGDGPGIVAFGDLAPWAAIDPSGQMMAAMGVEWDPHIRAISVTAPVIARDRSLMDHEADFLLVPGDYSSVSATSSARILLQIGSPEQPLTLATLGPGGGYVHTSGAVQTTPEGKAAWVIDPFGFLEAVLRQDSVPRPDPTTFQGLRIFFATILPTGWLDLMPALVFGEPDRLASEVLVNRVIDEFCDLPLSVAVLAGDLTVNLGGRYAARGRQAAMQAFATPNVEAAASGYSDIWDWDFFDRYDSDLEVLMMSASDQTENGDALVTSAFQMLRDSVSDPAMATKAQWNGAPRRYTGVPFDLALELEGSLDQVTAMAPPTRPARLFTWSGNARPSETALRKIGDDRVLAIGGGGGIMDAAQPSVTGLWPMSVQVGDQRQIYDALGGDAAYTGYWTQPLAGLHALPQTLRHTDRPRRLKPFHLVLSARSMVHFQTLRAVQNALQLARESEVVPVYAADYVATVKGFATMRIIPEGPGLWRIRDHGALRTLRLDNAREQVVDMTRSEGVMGARRVEASLYIALAPRADAPLIALKEGKDPSGIKPVNGAPLLVASRPMIVTWMRAACTLDLQVSGFAPGPVTLKARSGAHYDVAISGIADGQPRTMTADAEGMLEIMVPVEPGAMRGISISGGC